ncbi:enterochelin esterase domain-containing protein [Rothia nasimurium]|uniref:enterochelin esterase domain-containing protein n=1 Tax=Rothia nasimurium TaxID=85336 RepID=UPI002DD66B96|nr:enterochelin esterase domain-containing protein [Rothia nasimurium]
MATEHLQAQLLRTPPKISRPTPAPRTCSYGLSQLRARYRGQELEGAIKAWAEKGTPVLETVDGDGNLLSANQRTVTFLWHDAGAEEVLIFVNRLTDEKNLASSLLENIDGTDYWAISYRMATTWRASYCFIPAYPGRPRPWMDADNQVQLRAALDAGFGDPANPATCLNRAGTVMGLVALPDAPPQPYSLDATTCQSQEPARWLTHGERTYTVHALGQSKSPLPTVIFFDGEVWEAMGLPASLTAAHRDGILPDLQAVFLYSGGRLTRWAELDGSAPVADYLADDLLPALRTRGELAETTGVTLVGQSLGGLSALLASVHRPEVFTSVISSSASLWQPVLANALTALAKTGDQQRLAHLHWQIEVGEQEWVLLPPHEELRAQLADFPLKLTYSIYNGGHDYACWRGSIIDALARLRTR